MRDYSLLAETLKQSGAPPDKVLRQVLQKALESGPQQEKRDTEVRNLLADKLLRAVRGAEADQRGVIRPNRRGPVEKAIRGALADLQERTGRELPIDDVVGAVLDVIFPDAAGDKGKSSSGESPNLPTRSDAQTVALSLAGAAERRGIDRRYRQAVAALEAQEVLDRFAQRQAAEQARQEEKEAYTLAAQLLVEGKAIQARKAQEAAVAAARRPAAGRLGAIHFTRAPLPPSLR